MGRLGNFSLCGTHCREYVEFDIPAPFRRVVLNALNASPTSVDLRSQSAQFYTFAEKIMNLYDVHCERDVDVVYEIHMILRHRIRSMRWPRLYRMYFFG